MQLDYSVEPFKEPRGFLKILQWLFAICAFATTFNFTTEYGFTIQCNNNTSDPVKVRQPVQYPFALDHISKNYTCGNIPNLEVGFVGNAKSDAEFFVTTGVLCFLYATAVTALYVFADKVYMESNKLPMIDFFITVIFAVFWLSGSAAWAKGCSTLQDATDPQKSLFDLSFCKPPGGGTCSESFAGSFTGIVISILFGFINFILWSANLWFLYKETTWFESIMKNTGTSSTAATSSPST